MQTTTGPERSAIQQQAAAALTAGQFSQFLASAGFEAARGPGMSGGYDWPTTELVRSRAEVLELMSRRRMDEEVAIRTVAGEVMRAAGMAPLGTTSLSATSPEGVRAIADNPFTAATFGATPFIDAIRIGLARRTPFLGEYLFRRVIVGTPTYKFRRYGVDSFRRFDTRRPAGAPFAVDRRSYETDTGSLERRGFAGILDRDEIAANDAANAILGAEAVTLRADYAEHSRLVVENDLEYVRAELLLDPASYAAGLDVPLATPWDAVGGDSKGDVRPLAVALAAAHGLSATDVGVVLTPQSMEAAINDPTWSTLRANAGNADTPTGEQIARYWGVGEVVEYDATMVQDDTGVPTSLYGDVAILYLIPGRSQLGTTRESSMDAFVEFSWNPAGGLAREPVYKGVDVAGSATVWLFPWESWQTPTLIDPAAAAIIRNTAS